MTKHQQVLAWAFSHIGETEVPPSSNRGPFPEFCQSHTWLSGTGWPWCAAFAVTAIEEGAGVQYPDPSPGAWDLLRRADKRGWARPADYKRVLPGDLVVFNIGSGHVGVASKVTSKQVFSVDGNAGDRVRECARPLSTVKGFICWPENLPARERSTKFAQVVGGESGRRKLVIAGKAIPLPAVKDKIT